MRSTRNQLQTIIKICIVVGIFFCSFLSIHAQSSITSWSKVDTISNSDDIIFDVVQLPDSGYVLAGSTKTSAFPYPNNLLVRTDKNGDTLWTRTWGTSAYDDIYSIALRPGGGFIIAGDGVDRSFVFLDTLGNIESTHNYGSFTFVDITVLPDSGFILTGSIGSYPYTSDVAVMRADKNGDTLWTKTCGTAKADLGEAVIATSDGNFLIAGSANFEFYADAPVSPQRAYLLKIDPSGNLIWSDTIPGSVVYRSEAMDVLENKVGEYVMCGWSSSSNGLIANFSSSGTMNWYKEYVNPYTSMGYTTYSLYSIEQKCDGGYVAVGYETRPTPSVYGALVVSTNSTGDTLFTNAYGTAGYQAVLRSIIPTLDSGYFAGGYSIGPTSYSENPFLVKLDGQAGANGLGVIGAGFAFTATGLSTSFHDLSYGAINWYWDLGDGTSSTLQNPVHTYSSSGSYNVCLTAWNWCDTAYYCDTLTVSGLTTFVKNSTNVMDISISPQPVNDLLHIQFLSGDVRKVVFQFYDLNGREIKELNSSAELQKGENKFDIDISKLSAGAYLLRTILSSGESHSSKLIKID